MQTLYALLPLDANLTNSDEALKQFSFPVFNSRTTQRVIYGEALSSGKSVFNIESSGEAASEIQNITKELQNFIYEQKI